MNERTIDEIAESVLDRVGDRGEAAVSVQSGSYDLTRFANSFIHQNVAERRLQVALEVAFENRAASASIDRIEPDSLDRLVERTVHAARLHAADSDWPGLIGPTPVPDAVNWDDAVANATPEDRARRVAEFVEAGPGMRAAGFFDTEAYDVVYANNNGQHVRGRFTRTSLDGIHQTDSSAGRGHATSARWADIDGSAVGVAAAQTAALSQNPGQLEPGEYQVVLAPECVATMMVFLAFYGFNAKAAIEGQSFFEQGAMQFDQQISLIDDGTDPRAIGLLFDNQGVPKRRNTLIDSGVSRSLNHDRRTAPKMDTSSTGNAVPGSASFGPVATDLFLDAGGTASADMIAATERGVFVTEFNYCRILDPKTQVVTGLTRNGTFLIEDGRLAGPVTNLRFTQSFVDALQPGRVLAVGDDDRFARNEFADGTTHVPSLHLASWNFTGNAQG